MKKFLVVPLLFICGILAAQVIVPINPTVYGEHLNRAKVKLALGIPSKNGLQRNTSDTMPQIFLNTEDTAVYVWSNAGGYRKFGTGGAGGTGIIWVRGKLLHSDGDTLETILDSSVAKAMNNIWVDEEGYWHKSAPFSLWASVDSLGFDCDHCLTFHYPTGDTVYRFVGMSGGGGGGIESVTGTAVDNGDPNNPIINKRDFGIEDDLVSENRIVEINDEDHSFEIHGNDAYGNTRFIANSWQLELNATNNYDGDNNTATVGVTGGGGYLRFNKNDSLLYSLVQVTDNKITLTHNGVDVGSVMTIGRYDGIKISRYGDIDGSKEIVTYVNGIPADATGNVTITPYKKWIASISSASDCSAGLSITLFENTMTGTAPGEASPGLGTYYIDFPYAYDLDKIWIGGNSISGAGGEIRIPVYYLGSPVGYYTINVVNAGSYFQLKIDVYDDLGLSNCLYYLTRGGKLNLPEIRYYN